MSANRLTRALAPSIFQIEPGPPRGPQRPGMKAALRGAFPDVEDASVGTGGDDRQPIGGTRRHVDVRGRRVVERDGEHLPDLRGRDCERLRGADELRRRRPAHAAKIDDPQRGPARVDEGQRRGIVSGRDLRRRRRAGEAGDGCLARRDDGDRRLLRLQLGRRKGQKREDEGRRVQARGPRPCPRRSRP